MGCNIFFTYSIQNNTLGETFLVDTIEEGADKLTDHIVSMLKENKYELYKTPPLPEPAGLVKDEDKEPDPDESEGEVEEPEMNDDFLAQEIREELMSGELMVLNEKGELLVFGVGSIQD